MDTPVGCIRDRADSQVVQDCGRQRTARRDSQRQATLWNLDRAGYEGWARLITRGERDGDDVQQFKTKQREKVAAAGYTIIANMGDQLSDLEGGFAECAFKVPNPFYTVP